MQDSEQVEMVWNFSNFTTATLQLSWKRTFGHPLRLCTHNVTANQININEFGKQQAQLDDDIVRLPNR